MYLMKSRIVSISKPFSKPCKQLWTLQLWPPTGLHIFLCSILVLFFMFPCVLIILYNICVDLSLTCLSISLSTILSCTPDLPSGIISLFLISHPPEVPLVKTCRWPTLSAYLQTHTHTQTPFHPQPWKIIFLNSQFWLFSFSALKVFPVFWFSQLLLKCAV